MTVGTSCGSAVEPERVAPDRESHSANWQPDIRRRRPRATLAFRLRATAVTHAETCGLTDTMAEVRRPLRRLVALGTASASGTRLPHGSGARMPIARSAAACGRLTPPLLAQPSTPEAQAAQVTVKDVTPDAEVVPLPYRNVLQRFADEAGAALGAGSRRSVTRSRSAALSSSSVPHPAAAAVAFRRTPVPRARRRAWLCGLGDSAPLSGVGPCRASALVSGQGRSSCAR